jgi:NADH-quinone oxidoreductase subunit N
MILLLLVEAFIKDRPKLLPYIISFVGLGLAFASMYSAAGNPAKTIFSNALVIDPFSNVMKLVIITGTLVATFLSFSSKDIYKNLKSEFLIMVVGISVGAMLLISANNMLTMYLGIETLSILSYVIATMMKRNELSAEAGIKYALYGSITAGMMLYGMSHIYGVVGTLEFGGIGKYISEFNTSRLLILLPAFLLFFIGIGYKIAAVPFHMWAPDVYEGSPIPTTTFFSIVPKIAGIAALVRITFVFFNVDGGMLQHTWIGILSVIAALTMTVGNVAAVKQRSIKRLLAYSSISHAGVMMLGAIVIGDVGVQAVAFYAVVYLFMTAVAFYILSHISDMNGNDHLERFSGLIRRYPLMTILMTITLFSLAGLPPFAGFIAKFNILYAIIVKGYYVLAIIAVLNSVVSLYYYMRIVRVMVFGTPESTDEIQGFSILNQAVVFGLSVPIVLLGIYWNDLSIFVDKARIFIQ